MQPGVISPSQAFWGQLLPLLPGSVSSMGGDEFVMDSEGRQLEYAHVRSVEYDGFWRCFHAKRWLQPWGIARKVLACLAIEKCECSSKHGCKQQNSQFTRRKNASLPKTTQNHMKRESEEKSVYRYMIQYLEINK
jgi:hypothetical protein